MQLSSEINLEKVVDFSLDKNGILNYEDKIQLVDIASVLYVIYELVVHLDKMVYDKREVKVLYQNLDLRD